MKKYDMGTALQALKAGERVAREGWNGRDMYLFHMDTGRIRVQLPLPIGNPRGVDMGASVQSVPYEAHIVMKTADDKFVPWLASQTDLLARDWVVLSER